MTDNIKKFLEEASKNPKMQEELIKANNDYFQAIINAAKEQGITLTDKDIALLMNADKNHDGKISKDEMSSLNFDELTVSEDELAAVAGGKYTATSGGKPASDCTCAFGGIGKADEYQENCLCTQTGNGELTDYGKEEAGAGHIAYMCEYGSKEPLALFCFAALGWNDRPQYN